MKLGNNCSHVFCQILVISTNQHATTSRNTNQRTSPTTNIIIIQDDLQWDSHVREVKAKATKTFGLLHRNLSHCTYKVKEQAYNSLVRPRAKYATPAWAPYEKQHVTSIEAVQRSALRFITRDYSGYSSVTQMRETLGWENE